MPSLSTIFATVIGALLLVCCILGIIIYVDGNKIDTLNGQIAVCQAANKNMEAETKVQDAAVDKLAADQATLAAAAAKAENDATKADAPLAKGVDALKAAKPTTDACASADKLFDIYIGGKK